MALDETDRLIIEDSIYECQVSVDKYLQTQKPTHAKMLKYNIEQTMELLYEYQKEVQVDDEHTNKIVIDEKRNLGLVLNYPSLEITKAGFDVNSASVDTTFNVISACIDHIFEGDKTFPAKDSTREELKSFLEELPQSAFLNIRKFFDTMPQLRYEVEVKNPKTDVMSKVTFKGLQDFFQ